MNRIKITDIRVEDLTRVLFDYEVTGEWKRCFKSQRTAFIDYDEDISDVPYSVLAVPFICNIITAAWVCDATIEAGSLDADLMDHLDDIRSGFEKMYPMQKFGGSVEAERERVFSIGQNKGAACFFSGGLDAHATLLRHINEKPSLISIWGSDIKLDDKEGWDNAISHIKETAEQFEVVSHVVKSDFRSVLSEEELDTRILDTGEKWWHGFQSDLAVISHAAPLAYIYGWQRIYIASTFSEDIKGKYVGAGDPSIDDHVHFTGCDIVHDGYEINRQQKTELLVKYHERTGKKLFLRVCWEARGGKNCCRCEKCYRTVLGLVAEGADPNDYGFVWNKESISLCRQDLDERVDVYEYFYHPIQDRMVANKDKIKDIEDYKWFIDLDIDSVNDTDAKKRKRTRENQSRVAKSRINIAIGLLQYFLTMLLAWAGRMIFVRVLSEEYLGINGLFSDIINVLSIADLGLSTAMTYSLYKPLVEGDTKQIASLVHFFKKVFLFISGAVLAIGLILIPLLPYSVNLEKPVPDLTKYYLLFLLNTVISYLFVHRTTLFTADQKSYVLQKIIILFRFIAFVAQAAILFIFKDYILYLTVGIATGVICNIVQNQIAFRYYPYLKQKPEPLSSDERKGIWKNVFDLFIYRLSGVVLNNTDSILISIFAGTVIVGHYSNYQMMIFAVTSVLTIIFTNIKASLGNLIASKDTTAEKKLNVYWTMEDANFWLTAFCSISFVCLFQSFIELSYGTEYVVSIWTVIAIVLNFYTGNIRQPVWAFRETAGIFRETRFITAVTAVLNLVLSIVMGWLWGIFGVIIATVVSRMVYSWWKEPLILFNKCFGCSAKRYFTNYIVKFLLLILVGGVTYMLCSVINLPNAYIGFVLKAFCCLIFPNTVFLAIFIRNPDIRNLLNRLRLRKS